MDYEEMMRKLENLPGSYELFVDLTMNYIENDGIGEQLSSFMESNPDATASDLIKETNKLVYGA